MAGVQPFLGRHTTIQVTDFWHVSQYLAGAAEALYPRTRQKCLQEKADWLEASCQRLKHKLRRGKPDFKRAAR